MCAGVDIVDRFSWISWEVLYYDMLLLQATGRLEIFKGDSGDLGCPSHSFFLTWPAVLPGFPSLLQEPAGLCPSLVEFTEERSCTEEDTLHAQEDNRTGNG